MSHITRKASLLLAGLMIPLSLAFGFAEYGIEQSLAPEPPQQNDLVPIDIVNFDYLPPIAVMNVGDVPHWTNISNLTHTVTSGTPFDPNPGSEFDSGDIPPGGVFAIAFNTPGEFDYFCTPHSSSMFGTLIVGGTGVKVAVVPDDISSGALANLDMNVAVINFTPNMVSGNLWFTIFLPNNNEFVIPPQFLTPAINPLSGQLAGNNRLDLTVTLHVPQNAPSGEYRVVAKIGNYPNQVLESDDFHFEVP